MLKLKIKNMSDKKSLGTTFDSSPKRRVVELISMLTYKEFISSIKNVTNEKLSLFVELLLRYKNLTKPSFMNLNEYIINKKYNRENIKL